MRSLKITWRDSSTALRSAQDDRALRFGVPRFACLKVVATAVSAADSLILPRAMAAATSLGRRLHFHRGADLDVIVK
jgi:hypothetical protein